MKAEEDAIYPERDAMESGSLAFRGKEEEEREGVHLHESGKVDEHMSNEDSFQHAEHV